MLHDLRMPHHPSNQGLELVRADSAPMAKSCPEEYHRKPQGCCSQECKSALKRFENDLVCEKLALEEQSLEVSKIAVALPPWDNHLGATVTMLHQHDQHDHAGSPVTMMHQHLRGWSC